MNFQKIFSTETKGRGLYNITDEIFNFLHEIKAHQTGLLNVFIQHSSASLIIQENADPSAKQDLQTFLDRLIPDGESWHTHIDEGEDDSPSHMRSAITNTSLNIPVKTGKLQLGTWQGIYVWEHRHEPHQRNIVLTLIH